jgi:hypothetical protein
MNLELDTLDPARRPDDMTRSEWRAHLAHVFDHAGALISRGNLPADVVARLAALRTSIAGTLL